MDSAVLARRVYTIIGTGDEREDKGGEAYEKLCRLAGRLMGRRLTSKERKRLFTLAFTKKVKASVITRQLTAWRHGVGERDVRRMQRSLHAPVSLPSTVLVLKYDKDGQPVCDEDGRPVWWVPDENGQPAHRHVPGEQPKPRRVQAVRPRVKLIYR
jgi:hypothetical protein